MERRIGGEGEERDRSSQLLQCLLLRQHRENHMTVALVDNSGTTDLISFTTAQRETHTLAPPPRPKRRKLLL